MKINLIYLGVLILVLLILLSFSFKGKKTIEKKEIDFNKYEKAVFSGGCFWCSESDFVKLY
tara:strand:- start:18 stop:200 length:183 start_codon:yes stop_codon:yes gene_type:complete